MADLDDTANYALKLRPAEAVAWLVPKLDTDLAFARWRETRLRTRPGKRGRICDTAAELDSQSGTQPPFIILFEVEARPKRRMEGRLLEYLGRALLEFPSGPHGRDLVPVAVELLYLRGRRRDLKLKMIIPGTKKGLFWCVRPHCLARKSAARTLERIELGQLGKSILCWVPLMRGGNDPEVARRWAVIARTEADAELLEEYCTIAAVWAAWLKRDTIWKPVLEELTMWKSKLIEGWRQEGRSAGQLERSRTAVLEVLQTRFGPAIPEDLLLPIQSVADLEQLSAWLKLAALVSSLDEFRQKIQPAEANGARQRPEG